MCRPLFSLLLTSLTTPTPTPLTTPTTTLFIATFPILYVLEAAPAFFFAKSPISSPLLCFADDEIIQFHTLYGI